MRLLYSSVYYLRRVFKSFMKALDWKDKPTGREFSEKFNIMDSVINLPESWNEVKPSLVRDWKYVWSGFNTLYQIQKDNVALAKQNLALKKS